MSQRNAATERAFRASTMPEEARENGHNGASTSEMVTAIARDTLDVATELVRDGVALGRLEVERAARSAIPRILWGGITIVCAATASVCAVIAIMIGLGSVVPSIAWRLVILALALSLVALFGSVRAWRPEHRSTSRRTKEEPIEENPPRETWSSRRTERLANTILPPPNA